MVAERSSTGRVLSKRQRILRARRRQRFVDDAARHNDAPGSLLADPDYHMTRACGWDVARRDAEFRKPEPPLRRDRVPNPHYNAAAREPVPSVQCATWLWWKALGKDSQDELYDLSIPSHDFEGSGYVTVRRPLLADNDPRNVNEWGR